MLLPALAAAVMVGMRSLSGAFVAGVGISVLDQLVQWRYIESAPPASLVLLIVIVVMPSAPAPLGAPGRRGRVVWTVVGVGRLRRA